MQVLLQCNTEQQEPMMKAVITKQKVAGGFETIAFNRNIE
jgi:hypothetical protein